MQALRAGFGSVMYDGSREKTSEENIRKSAEIVRIAHGMGVGVECELGSVGGLTDSNGKVDQMVYTEPEEAQCFVDQTGTDFLAVSIGTCHGVYQATPKLDIPRLREIRKTVSVPLVLHGGSGLSDDDFRNTVAGGISKINVFTDVILAAKRAIDSANLAHMLVGTRTISFDMVVRTMYETGISMNRAFRETSEGGLARLYSRRAGTAPTRK